MVFSFVCSVKCFVVVFYLLSADICCFVFVCKNIEEGSQLCTSHSDWQYGWNCFTNYTQNHDVHIIKAHTSLLISLSIVTLSFLPLF